MTTTQVPKASKTLSLKVAIFHATLPSAGRKLGGVELTVHRLANALVEYTDCHVTVFSCGPCPGDARYHHRQVSSREVAASRLLRLVFLPFRLNFVNFEEFNVLHLHGDDWFFAWRRTPTVRTLHGSALLEARTADHIRRKILQYLVYPLEHLSSRLATRSVAVGVEAAKIYHTAGIADNGVDLKNFAPRPKTAEPLLVFIGTWHGRKRGSFAYRTFIDHVLPRWPTATLYMACDRVPVHANVIDGGFPSDSVLADWLARAWLFMYPTLYEGFGIAYIEAMASGTAIVTTRNSGADYVLEHGRFGEITDDASFGVAVCKILENDEARRCLETAGLKRAKFFSWSKVSEKHVCIYQSAIDHFGRE